MSLRPSLLLTFLLSVIACSDSVQSFRVGNQDAERHIQIGEGTLTTTSLARVGARQLVPLKTSAEFAMRLSDDRELTAADFSVTRTEHAADESALDVTLEGEGLVVHVHYWATDEGPELFKKIEVEIADPELRILELDVDALDFEEIEEAPRVRRSVGEERKLDSSGRYRGGIGIGQPIFIEDYAFAALEYPAADNRIEDSTIRLRHFPGRTGASLEGAPLVSKTAVWGLGPEGQVQATFRSYLAERRTANQRMRHFIDAFHLRGRANIGVGINGVPSPEELEEAIEETPLLADRVRTEENALAYARSTREFSEDFGVELDAFTIDGGWQDWRSLFEVDDYFLPRGFGPIASEAGAPLGLWNSLVGFRLDLRHLSDSQGFPICPPIDLAFDLSDPSYREAIGGAIERMASEHQPVYWKQDFNFLVCPTTTELHTAHDPQSMEANLDALLALVEKEREINPDVVIAQTTGTWPSPFWLFYVDHVVSIRADYGYEKSQPAYHPRDAHISFVDQVMYRNFVLDNAQYPTSRLMTHGIIRDQYVHVGGDQEAFESWANGVVAHMAPGLSLQELYLDPELLPEEHARFLADAFAWFDERSDLLFRYGEMFGGDPQLGLPYGFVHSDGERELLFVRNPSPKSRSLEVPFELVGSEARAVQHYPVARLLGSVGSEEPFSVELAPFEVAIVEFLPEDQVPAELEEGSEYGAITIDGALVRARRTAASVPLPSATIDEDESGVIIADGDPDTSSTLHVLVDAEEASALSFTVLDDEGEPAPVEPTVNTGPCGPLGCPLVQLGGFVEYRIEVGANEHVRWQVAEDAELTMRSVWLETSMPAEVEIIDQESAEVLFPTPLFESRRAWQLVFAPSGDGSDKEPLVLDGVYDGRVELSDVEMLVVSDSADDLAIDLEERAGGKVTIPTVIDPEAGTIAVYGTRAQVGDAEPGPVVKLYDVPAVGEMRLHFEDYFGVYDASTGSISLPLVIKLQAIIFNFTFDFDLVATTGSAEITHNGYTAQDQGQILATDGSFALAGAAVIPADVPLLGDLPTVVTLIGELEGV